MCLQSLEELRQFLTRELPRERMRCLVGEFLIQSESDFDLCQVRERIGWQHLAWNNGKVDCDLVEPTGMDGGMDHDQGGIGQCEPLACGLPPMGRPVVHHPEDPLARAVWLLAHDLGDKPSQWLDPGVWFAASYDVPTADLPPCQGLPRAATLVFVFDAMYPPWRWRQARMAPDTGWDTGLFIGTNHVILGAKGCALPYPSVQIQNPPSLLGQEWITGKNPVRVLPGFKRIGL